MKMTEAQVGFLYNIAASVTKSNKDELDVLKSYYLMRCKDITRGYGLPDKYFNPKIRCPKCCIEWKSNTEVKVNSIKLSKRQKKRLKSKKITQNRKQSVRCRKELINSNQIEQMCMFCKKKTITTILKPQKELPEPTVTSIESETPKEKNNANQKQNTYKKPDVKKGGTHVYANAINIFSMENKNNVLASTIREKPKIINNNKKKKDKFAGLCQKAVLASAKIKEQNKKQNILNLFLKPSS